MGLELLVGLEFVWPISRPVTGSADSFGHQQHL